ncbi:MAG: hypothetical protein R3E02_01400 [Blastomonas sp.]
MAFALLGLWLVARTALVLTANQGDRTLPMALWPDDADQIVRRADLNDDQIDWEARDKDLIIDNVRAANDADPLNYWNFVLAALVAREQGETDKSNDLLMAAKLRDPRNFGPRYFLIQNYLATNSLGPAMDEIIRTARLRSDPRLIKALLVLSQTPDGRNILIDGLQGDSRISELVLLEARQSDEYADLLTTLIDAREIDENQRFAAITATANRGNYRLARALWKKADPDAPVDGAIFDTGFDGLKAPEPFGWTISQNSYVAGEISAPAKGKDRLLNVEYYGMRESQAAAQTIFQRPGLYRLTARGRAIEPHRGAGNMVWAIKCAGTAKGLGVIEFSAGTAEWQQKSLNFEIPAGGCNEQILELIGRPGSNSAPYQMQFESIALQRAGA